MSHPDKPIKHHHAKIAELHALAEHHRGSMRAWLFWFIGALFYFFEFFLRDMGSTIEAELQGEFKATSADMSFTWAMYLWAYAPMQLVVGGLLDRYGSKYLLPIASILCAIGCLLMGLAHDLTTLGFARAFIGVGSAFAFVGAIYVCSVWFSPARMGLLVGMTVALGSVGGIIAQTPMVFFQDEIGWRNVAFVCACLSAVIAILIYVIIPRRPEWFTVLFLQGPHSFRELFVGLRKVALNPQIWMIGLVAGALWLPISVLASLWGTSFLINLLDITPKIAASGMVAFFIGFIIGGPCAGFISDKIHRRRMPAQIGIVGSAISVIAIIFFGVNLMVIGTFAVLFVLGIFAGTQVIQFAHAIEVCPGRFRATAVAFTNFIVMMLGAFMMWGFGELLSAVSTNTDQIPPLSATAISYDTAMAASWSLAPNTDVWRVSEIWSAVSGAAGGSDSQLTKIPISSWKIAMLLIPVSLGIALIISFFIRETHGRSREDPSDGDSQATAKPVLHHAPPSQAEQPSS